MKTNHHTQTLREFEQLVEGDRFPCFAGRTAQRRHLVDHLFAGHMACPADDQVLAEGIARFATDNKPEDTFRSLVVHFEGSDPVPEHAFEDLLFARLQGIHEADARAHAWDPSVSDDADDPGFSMSIGGKAFYVVGLHPGASRPARRLAHPALVFNLHSQFEYLRQEGRYERLKAAIIDEDIARNGSANPMLAVHGESSEAIQYSGRHITGEWHCPFAAVHPQTDRETA
ncbi:guanitoxin biosynthesis heme-dependent pre-guanitoxin N-hydroxylase GntA [Luteibacter aegosomatissinici]|uniref:guanitoxin biosynthesis heme-dependent pre-guanitoxin N-hydroxylase GntA n=1 Tax=Luteibacter aegosomatissinici TaxID=2911539 RepID=UPI001FFA6487|nr:guanitoxin biosynthesis heme-dependent pre-guanitoxin N-hydroxylase GntA [Luteibacter aegosomatissinici]UPG96567.1 YqcI/YcgG family protein [Luteibacter aegosomatissinici]